MFPGDTDILVTRGPPFGVLDHRPGTDRHDGCQELRAAVTRIRPRLHVFGHIHGAYGVHREGGIVFVNAALLAESNDIEYSPIVVELDADGTGNVLLPNST
jgi:Icc-related predicted phosphoesterase